MNINELKDRAYKIACEHGWYDDNHSDSAEVMLVITELSEAVNADRIGKYAQRKMFERESVTPQLNSEEHWRYCYQTFIKDTVEDELADAIIRILSFAGCKGISLTDEFFVDSNIREAVKGYEYARKRKGESPYSFPAQMFTVVGGLSDIFKDECETSMEEIMCQIFITAYLRNIDLFWHIEQKLKYNESRPYKHGKKY